MGGLTSLSALELMALPDRPIQYIVEGLLPVGVIIIAGKPKVGKSWFALQLAIAVANGTPFLDRAVLKGGVLYLALEDFPPRLKQRLAMASDATTSLPVDLHFATHAPRVDEGLCDALRQWAERHGAPKLIIIDTFTRVESNRPANQSDYFHSNEVIAELRSLASEFGASVVLVHHERKGGNSDDSGDPFDGILGSTGLFGAADLSMLLHKKRLSNDGRLLFTGRDVEEGDIPIRFDAGSMHWLPVTVSATDEIGATAAQEQILQFLVARKSAPLAEIAEAIEKSRPNTSNILSRMVKSGALHKTPAGSYALSDETAKAFELADSAPLLEIPDHVNAVNAVNGAVVATYARHSAGV